MPPMRPTQLAAAIAFSFSAVPPVAAQGAPEVVAQPIVEPSLPEVKVKATQDEPGFRTDVTRTGTRTETPLRDIPQFINTVPQSLIRSQNATTLQDALRNVPGISYAAAEVARRQIRCSTCAAFQSIRTFSSTPCATSANTTATCSPPKP